MKLRTKPPMPFLFRRAPKRLCDACYSRPCQCDRRSDEDDSLPPERIDSETARVELGLDLGE